MYINTFLDRLRTITISKATVWELVVANRSIDGDTDLPKDYALQ